MFLTLCAHICAHVHIYSRSGQDSHANCRCKWDKVTSLACNFNSKADEFLTAMRCVESPTDPVSYVWVPSGFIRYLRECQMWQMKPSRIFIMFKILMRNITGDCICRARFMYLQPVCWIQPNWLKDSRKKITWIKCNMESSPRHKLIWDQDIWINHELSWINVLKGKTWTEIVANEPKLYRYQNSFCLILCYSLVCINV